MSVSNVQPRRPRALVGLALALVCALTVAFVLAAPEPRAKASSRRPNVLVITVDTLRADHMSGYGYARRTTPNLDKLMSRGVRFTQARTVEPLTSPALCSMLTSQHPHEHGSSRNGLRMRSGLVSLPRVLRAEGWRTAAFVGNWTLRDKLSGLGEHFGTYEEVLTRKRWLGLVSSESTAEDLTESALDWLEAHDGASAQPFFVWVHYVEPHAPYRLQEDFVQPLGLGSDIRAEDRYDTEIAYVDRAIGRLLAAIDAGGLDENTIVVFASDHGESLGEHNYWGHGRHLYEPTLHIPMALVWPGQVVPRTVDASALNIDLAPTVLSLIGIAKPRSFEGYDWTQVLRGAAPPAERVTHHQAHRGAVLSRHDSDLARRAGLLEVALVRGSQKEIYRVEKGRHWRFDLRRDPDERNDLTATKAEPSADLVGWMRVVYQGLNHLDAEPPVPLDEEDVEQLRSLGYAE